MDEVKLALEMNKLVHDECKDVPHDIGLRLLEIVKMNVNEQLRQPPVSGSVLSNEEMREPIEDALYATQRFLTTQATDLAEGILEYIKDAGFTIVRTDC